MSQISHNTFNICSIRDLNTCFPAFDDLFLIICLVTLSLVCVCREAVMIISSLFIYWLVW